MNPEDIKWNDWQRILLGDTPPEFFIEVIIRPVILFLLLIFSLRLMGRRMAAKTSRIELTALFTLAAAIGVPLQAPERGLLPAVVIAFVVTFIGRQVAVIAFKDQRMEDKIIDELAIMVRDGIVQMGAMKNTGLTIERLMARLREAGIRHLGEVKRMYFEANGSFSLVKNEKPPPGLTVIPASDKDFLDEQKQTDINVCRTCGNNENEKDTDAKCSNCGDKKFVPAIR